MNTLIQMQLMLSQSIIKTTLKYIRLEIVFKL